MAHSTLKQNDKTVMLNCTNQIAKYLVLRILCHCLSSKITVKKIQGSQLYEQVKSTAKDVR